MVGNSWLGYQPFYVQNVLHPELVSPQLNVTMLVSDVSVIRMLTNQAAAVAFLSLDNALSLNSRTDLNFCVASVLTSSYGADAVLARPEFARKFKHELKQKTATDAPIVVGMEDSALSRFVLSRWLQLHGIDETRVQRQIVTPAGQLQAFESKQFDAVISYAPFSKRLEQAGAVTIFTSREIPDEVIDTVIVRQSAWQAHSKLLSKYVTENWDKALAAISNTTSKDFVTFAQLAELTPADLQLALNDIQTYDSTASKHFLQSRYTQVAATVANHLIESGLHDAVRPLPVCEGIL